MFRSRPIPSLSAARVQVVQEALNTAGAGAQRLPVIVATGRTGSGKSTLGNTMLGSRHLLRSTGHIDCTDRAQVVRFPRGLEYVDLPGVSSDEKFENVNRAVLGLPQVDTWPRADLLQVDVCTPDGAAEARTYRADATPAPFEGADVICYLLAGHHQITPSDRAYLADLLAVHVDIPVLFVLNRFSDPLSGTPSATSENVSDLLAALSSAHADAGREPGSLCVVEVDCSTGDGLDELLVRTQAALGPELGAPLAEVIGRQRREAPAIYAEWTRSWVVDLLADLMVVTPSSEEDARVRLASAVGELLALVPRAPGRDGIAAELDRIVPDLVLTLREEVTRARLTSKSQLS